MFLAYIDPGTGFTVATGGSFIIAVLATFFAPFLIFFKKIWGFFKKHKKIFILLLLILASAAIIMGVMMKPKTSDFNKRLVILGLDGLSPDIVERLMNEGKLPNFSILKEAGAYRHLATTNPPQSPIAWSGFATGMNPGKHGMFDFLKRSPKNYMMEIAQTNIVGGKALPVRDVKSFWHYTSEKNIPTTIIACPITFPPDAINGRMLSGMGVPDILGTQGTFTFYTTEHLTKDKDTGGKVFEVTKKPMMRLDLIGPKVGSGVNAKNITIPFVLQLKSDGVKIDVQKQEFTLKEKEWSDWISVSFKISFLKTIKGICKFYLVEREPELKLYITPINMDPRDPLFAISYPRNYSKELVDHVGLFYTQGMPLDTWAVNEHRLSEEPFLEIVNEVVRERKKMLNYELQRLDKGVLYCYFEDPDIIQHMFWRYRDPQHPLYEKDAPDKYKNFIDNWYIHLDKLVGDVMSQLNPDDMLIVLSDHGFNTFRRAVHVNSWLRKQGYLVLKNNDAESGQELFLDVDWSKTKAYAMGFGGIYINQRGREAQGIVAPGQETEALKQEIITKLKTWKDAQFHSAVISEVYKREDIFWGPHAASAPDLFIGFNIGYRASWQTAIGGCPTYLIEDNLKKWSGTHLIDPKLIPGILLTNFPVAREAVSIYDVCPSILEITGYTKDEIAEFDLDGTSFIAE